MLLLYLALGTELEQQALPPCQRTVLLRAQIRFDANWPPVVRGSGNIFVPNMSQMCPNLTICSVPTMSCISLQTKHVWGAGMPRVSF